MKIEDKHIDNILEIIKKHIPKDSLWVNNMTEELQAYVTEINGRLDLEKKASEITDKQVGELQFRDALNKILEGVQIISFDWRYLYVNDSLVKHSHYTREELIGHTMMQMYPGIEKSEMFGVLKQCMEARNPYHIENEFVYPNNTKAWFELSVQPVPEGIFVLSIDITERKNIEEKLRNSQLEYRSLIDQATDGIFISDEKGNYVDVNVSACDMLGYSKEELIHMAAKDILSPEDVQNNPPRLSELKSGKSILNTRNLKKKDGSFLPVEINAKMLSNGTMLGIVRDITERKKAEESVRKLNEELEFKVMERTAQLERNIEQLKESEERFQKAFQASAAGIAITRLSDGTYSDVNDAFTQMIGYSKEELLGHSSMELGLIVNFQQREEVLQHIMEFGWAKHFEITIRQKSGKLLEVLSSAETILLNGEKYAINIIFDITDRKKAEEELKKSDVLFSSLFENNPAAFAISRIRDGVILAVNEAFLRLFGFRSKKEVIGKTGAELNVMNDPEQKNEILRQLKETNRVVNLEGSIRMSNGEMKWTSGSIITIELDDEPCILAVVLDITERRKAEEQLVNVNRELEAFTYSVSHDLRAPLRAVSGYAQILHEDYTPQLDHDGQRIIQVIKSNATKMGTLIDDLLAFSRLGRKELNRTKVDMNKLIASVTIEIKKAINNDAEIKVGTLHTIEADYGLLHQVMFNLVANAVKYSSKKENPIVQIASEQIDNEVVFSVKDNGAGFDMLYADKLFGVFQRLHSQEEFEGTGVGLAIVQRIIAKHGGRVWAEGQVDVGASFYFSLIKN